MRIAVGAMMKASAAAAVITHLGKRRDFIHMATASISYVFQMQLLEAASHESAPTNRWRAGAGNAEALISRNPTITAHGTAPTKVTFVVECARGEFDPKQ